MGKSKILTTDRQFRLNIENKLTKIVKQIQLDLAPKIERIVKTSLKSHFDNDETIQSILGSQSGGRFSLQQEFGLTDALALEAAVYIIDSIVDSVSINFVYKNVRTSFLQGWIDYLLQRPKNELGSIEIVIAPESFQFALSQRFAYISNVSNIPWLNWLLTQGGRVVVDGYSVGPSGSFLSRAGGALMRKKGVYRVDPIHSGVIGDNFITRGIEEVIPTILNQIRDLIGQK